MVSRPLLFQVKGYHDHVRGTGAWYVYQVSKLFHSPQTKGLAFRGTC